MIRRRGSLPVLVLLGLVLIGVVGQTVRGPTAATSGGQPGASATPAPTPTARERAVLSSLAVVESAYDAGDVRLLCRPGALIDPAVIRALNAHGNGCEGRLESLIANVPRLQLTISGLDARAGLATATVVPANGSSVTVDFVPSGGRWLLSFSDGNDPLPALAGTT